MFVESFQPHIGRTIIVYFRITSVACKFLPRISVRDDTTATGQGTEGAPPSRDNLTAEMRLLPPVSGNGRFTDPQLPKAE